MLSVCDEEVFGCTVEENGLQMCISNEFYGGGKVDEKKLIELLKTTPIISLAGNRCVELAVKKGFAHRDAIKKVKSISFLMIFKFMRG
jgi:hypothetical protein